MTPTLFPFLCLMQLQNSDCSFQMEATGGLAVMEQTSQQQQESDEIMDSPLWGNSEGWGNAVGATYGLGMRMKSRTTARLTMEGALALEWSTWEHQARGENSDHTIRLTRSESMGVLDVAPSLNADLRLLGRLGLQAGAGFSIPVVGYHAESVDLNYDTVGITPEIHTSTNGDLVFPIGPEVWMKGGFGFGLFHPSLSARAYLRYGLLGRNDSESISQVLGASLAWALR